VLLAAGLAFGADVLDIGIGGDLAARSASAAEEASRMAGGITNGPAYDKHVAGTGRAPG
jgi:hypothetical protein